MAIFKTRRILHMRCTRHCQHLFLVAMASCILTGNIYQFMLSMDDSDTTQRLSALTNSLDHVSLSVLHLETKPNTTSPPPPSDTVSNPLLSDSLYLLSKYYPENVVNKNIYTPADFSFFWVQGDGSPLYINASKYNHIKGYKSFVFCPIPKVGCSSWKQVIKRIKGSPVYLADDYWSLHNPEENELDADRIHRFGVDGANQLLINPNQELFHAAFVRDPIARALSAFLDKCINAFWIGKPWCTPHSRTRRTLPDPNFPNNDMPFGTYSHFDLFIENIINKPMLPTKEEPVAHQIWMSDFHWFPQSFICDIYKFIDRYHIYHADNRLHRKQFLLDIGGEELWEKIGSYGWMTRDKKMGGIDPKPTVRLHYATGNKTIRSSEYFSGVFKYYRNVTSSWREHPPSINKYTLISDVNVSLLDSQTFHQSGAQSRLLEYYRSDLLAKAMVYYAVDYKLFNRTIPDIVCNYLQYDALRQLMKSIAKYFRSGTMNVEVEKAFGLKAKNIFNGYSAIYNQWSKRKGYKTIYVDRNGTNTLLFDRDKWTFDTNLDTKIPHLYDMMDFDDAYKEITFGVGLAGLRGMATLVNVMSVIDPRTWPTNDKCFYLRKHGWSLQDTIQNELHEMMSVVHTYFVNILPVIRNTLPNEQMKYVDNKIRIWTDQGPMRNDFSNLNVAKLITKWIEEDKALYANIKAWVLYQRDVPRQMFYQKKHGYTEREMAYMNLQRHK
eukprot:46694_1